MIEEIQISKNVVLKDCKFVVKFGVNFLKEKKKKILQIPLSDQTKGNKGLIDSYIEGFVEVEVEPGRYLNFFTKIDASNTEMVTLDGVMNGLFMNVLGVEHLHLS